MVTGGAGAAHAAGPERGAAARTVFGVGVEPQLALLAGTVFAPDGVRPAVTAENIETGAVYDATVIAETYAISDVPYGQYLIRATGTHDGMEYTGYYGGRTAAQATPVTVAGPDIGDLDITMYISNGAGGIAGTIGTAAPGFDHWYADITAYRWDGTTWASTATTSGWGSYLLGASDSGSGPTDFDLPAGEYLVSFTDPGDFGDDYPFCEQWFEGSLTMAGASPLTVTSGELTEGVDASLTLKEDDCQARVIDPGHPIVTGTAAVGETLTAHPGSWQPQPVELAYQWTADGVEIDGATDSSYVLTDADVGTVVTVTVTGSRPGYAPVAMTATGLGPVAGELTPQTPVITGPAVIGGTLAADPGAWTPGPVTFAYV